MLSLVAALASLALAVCLLDLVLTLGVIRRLREHTRLISETSHDAPPAGMLAEGETAEPFEAHATTGEVVSRDALPGQTLVGAFTPHCPACVDRMPAFVGLATGFPGGRDHVIAVISAGPGEDATAYQEQLEPVARVVVEPPMSGLCDALRIRAFPSAGLLDGSGKVLNSRLDMEQNPTTAGV